MEKKKSNTKYWVIIVSIAVLICIVRFAIPKSFWSDLVAQERTLVATVERYSPDDNSIIVSVETPLSSELSKGDCFSIDLNASRGKTILKDAPVKNNTALDIPLDQGEIQEGLLVEIDYDPRIETTEQGKVMKANSVKIIQ